MPHKCWVHKCKKDRGTIRLGIEVCPDCGQHGQYDGWGFSMNEAMLAYQLRTGLKPIGPHRDLAHKLLDPKLKACEQCKGRGVINDESGGKWKECPSCHFAQYLFDGTKEEFEALRQEILIKFPDADAKPGSVSTKSKNNAAPSSYVGGGFFRPPLHKSLEAYNRPNKGVGKKVKKADSKPELTLVQAKGFGPEDYFAMLEAITGREPTAADKKKTYALLKAHEAKETAEATKTRTKS